MNSRRCKIGIVAVAIIVGLSTAGCAGPALGGATAPTNPAKSTLVALDSATSATAPDIVDGQPPVDPSSSAAVAQPELVQAAPTTPTQAAVPPDMQEPIAPAGAGAPVMISSRPVRLQIPALGVDSDMLDLGLQNDGTLEVPPDGASVGWFTGGPTPGALGPAVIVGHVDWAGELGLFYYLKDLAPQDEITVTRADASVAHFRVTSVEQFPKGEFPTDSVYGNIGHAGLRLITCGGEFDRQARSYTDNIVVFASLVDAGSG